MNKKKIIKMYEVDQLTLRQIANKLNTNHKLIGRILTREGIKITRRNGLRVFTAEHRRKISEACKGRKAWSEGKKMSRISNLKNMQAHLKYDVQLEWLDSFPNIEKLKYLNRSLSRKRDCEGFTTEIYKAFIEKFYYDEKFNALFEKWVETKDKWIKPSLDHIHPKCKGGKLEVLGNLKFISWLENRTKTDIGQDEWELIKKRIGEYF